MAGSSACDSRSIPITAREFCSVETPAQLTLIDHFEFTDQVKTDLAKLVLQEVQKERQEVLDGRLSAQQWRKAGDLHSKGCSNMLARVGGEVFDAWKNSSKDNFSVEQFSEAFGLVSMTTDERRNSPGTCPAPAVLTSASLSLSKLTKAPTSSSRTIP